jgi:hypothetical protein
MISLAALHFADEPRGVKRTINSNGKARFRASEQNLELRDKEQSGRHLV